MIGLHIAIDDLNRWPGEHLNAAPADPRITEYEHQINYKTIAMAQSTRIKLEKDIEYSNGTCN